MLYFSSVLDGVCWDTVAAKLVRGKRHAVIDEKEKRNACRNENARKI